MNADRELTLDAHESFVLTGLHGFSVRITCTHTGELEIERLDGGTITAVPLSRSLIMLLTLPVSPRQA